MSSIGDSKLGKKSTQGRIAASIRNFGHSLPTPNFRRRSRSLSPAPPASPSSDRKTPPVATITPSTQVLSATNTRPTAGPSAPSHTFASSADASPTGTGTGPAISPTLVQTPPTPTALLQTLSPLEIRQRTADLLKDRLTPEEVEEIKWDETTPEQAKAVVEGVQKSLEGKPEHAGKMYKALQYVNKYSTIVDVAIQHQPCITALVWAGMRTVIQVGHRP